MKTCSYFQSRQEGGIVDNVERNLVCLVSIVAKIRERSQVLVITESHL